MHLWAKKRQPGQQLTLTQLGMATVVEVTAKLLGLCSPGSALIRRFFLAEYDATIGCSLLTLTLALALTLTPTRT